jgi:Fibronectin type III domain.
MYFNLYPVPEAPEKVKAVSSSESAAFIGWLPPRRPNGMITKYTVHLRVLDQGREMKIVKDTVAAHQLHYEVSGLFSSKMYEAWVTAATRVGQGAGTPVVRLSPATSSSGLYNSHSGISFGLSLQPRI